MVKEPSGFCVTSPSETYVASPLRSARTPRSSATFDLDAPSPTRTPPPISVTHVQSSRRVVVKLQSHELSTSASVAKYEKPPAPNPYSWSLPALSATCGPARSEVM